jgi:hypothetical protein
LPVGIGVPLWGIWANSEFLEAPYMEGEKCYTILPSQPIIQVVLGA